MLQKYVNKILNIEQKSVLKCDRVFENGEVIEEQEITEEEGEIKHNTKEV